MSEPSTARLVGAEFVGTAVVVLGGPGLLVVGGDDIGTLGVAIGFGASLAVAMGVIGAIANPMFSLALWFTRSISNRELLADWVGQVVGAVFAGAVLFGLNDMTRLSSGTNGWDPGRLDEGIDLGIGLSGFADLGVVLAAELVIGTLVTVVLLSAVATQESGAAVAAFTGAAYTIGALFLLGISGAGINPARSIGIALFADTDPNALVQLWAFVVVPLLAAFIGTVVWLAIDDAEIDDTVFDDTFLEDAVDALAGDENVDGDASAER